MDDQHQKTQTRDADKHHDQASSHSQDRSDDRQRSGDTSPRTVAPKSEDERKTEEGGSTVGGTVSQATTMVRNVGEQAWSAATNAGGAATDLARQAGEQVGDALTGTTGRAGEYISRNVNAYPLAALMIAGAVGYGMGYLFHNSWQTQDNRRGNRGDNQTGNRSEQNHQKREDRNHDTRNNDHRNHKR